MKRIYPNNNPLIIRHPRAPVPRIPYLCKSCSRKYSTSPTPQIPTKIPESGFAHLSTRRLVSLHGRDSTKYLHGMITGNVEWKARGGFYSAFLNARGRLLYDVFVYPDGSGDGNWLIEVDAKEVDLLAKHLLRYRMSSKFEVRVVGEEEMSVWSLWGADGVEVGENVVGCSDSRAPGMGRRLVLEGGKKPQVEVEESGVDVYRVRRYLNGVPEGQDELLREAALPQESNIDVMGGIDYTKGCYLGQELTIRTYHQGLVRKRVVPMMVLAEGEEWPQRLEWRGGDVDGRVKIRGDIKKAADGGAVKGRAAGKWLAGVGNLGLGLARLESMGGWRDCSTWISNDDEFEAEGKNDEKLRVRTFPPVWFKETDASRTS
ncbi:ccr4 associated factor [Clarireedia jacksonii]